MNDDEVYVSDQPCPTCHSHEVYRLYYAPAKPVYYLMCAHCGAYLGEDIDGQTVTAL